MSTNLSDIVQKLTERANRVSPAVQELTDLSHYGDFTLQRLAELNLQRLDLDTVVATDDFMRDCINAQPQLDALQLGIYEDAWGNILLGSTDEQLHAHDRWLKHARPAPAGERVWYDMRHHAIVEANGEATVMLSKPQPIRDLSQDLRATLAAVQRMNLQDRLSDFWRVNHVNRSVGKAILVLLEKVETPSPDLHDLLFHYGTWAKQNPEFAELPFELVRRMYGLGAVLEQAAAIGPSPYGEIYNVDLSEL